MKPTLLQSRRPMTIVPLVAATYFMVSGGPYGLEEIVSKTGFSRSIIILLLTPLLWSLPTALMIGELSSAIPAEGGFYVWVRRAMGPFWGFQEAWLSLVASIFDMALYPTLFVLYLARLWPAAGERHMAVVIAAAVVVACVIWNLRGAASVGQGSVALGVVLLAPFAVLTAAALVKSHGHVMPHAPAVGGSSDLLGGILIAMWNYQGWDNASTVAGEVKNPQRTYPFAMFAAVALVTLTYVLPVGAVWLTGIDPSHWTTGSWVDVGSDLVGKYLGTAIVLGGMIGGFGAFNSLVLSYSRVPFAMAEDGLLPSIFTRQLASNGAPWVAIIVCGVAWLLALGLSFTRLIILDIMLYGLSLVLEFIALVVLRLREPELVRPFRIPGGTAVAVLLGIAPTLLIGLALVRNRSEHIGSVSALWIGIALITAGPLAYWIARRNLATSNVAAGTD